MTLKAISQRLSGKRTGAAIDRSMAAVAVIHPATALPQVIQIYATRNVTGVSLLTWLGFMTIGVVFLAYALRHLIRPMIVTQMLWFAIDFAVVTGILMFR